MTLDQAILFALFALVFGMMLWGRFRYDIVALSALLAGVVLGVVDADDAFSGFGHPATIIVALVLVVSAGLVRSGAVFLITRTLVDSGRSLGAHIAIMGGVGGVLSAFMNHVAALALLMPVDIQTARKAGRAPGLSLMPLSFATILGGMVTLIGTPPNIIIASIREDQLGEAFAMFDFAPVGGVTALVGLAFVALIGWRLIPEGGGADAGGDPLAEIAQYIAELTVPEGSKLIGQRVEDLYETAEKNDVAILGLVRGGKRRFGTARNTRIAAADALVIEAKPAALDEFRAALSLDFADTNRTEALEAAGDGLTLVEIVVPEGARIAGKTAQAVGLAWRQRTVLMGIARQGRRITSQVRKTVILPGDILLLLAPREAAQDVVEWLGGLPLAERGLAVTEYQKVWLAIAIFGGAVAAAALGLIYLPVAMAIVVVAYVLPKATETVVTLLGGGNCEGRMGWTLHQQCDFVDYTVSGEADALLAPLCADILTGAPDLPSDGLPSGVVGPAHRGRPTPPDAALYARVADMSQVALPDFDPYFDGLSQTSFGQRVVPGLPVEAVTWVVPHQANLRIIKATAQRMGVPMERVVVTVQDHGNTSAASIPLALSVGKARGQLTEGDLLVVEAIGGGLAWGSVVLRW